MPVSHLHARTRRREKPSQPPAGRGDYAAASIALIVGVLLCGFGFARTLSGAFQREQSATSVFQNLPHDSALPTAVMAGSDNLELADEWWREPVNPLGLGILDLSTPLKEGLADAASAADAAEEEFQTSLARAPGDAFTWAWLAQSRLVSGSPRSIADPLSMSIRLARFDPTLLAWRCRIGLAIYPSLDDEQRQQINDQLRTLGRMSTPDLARLARSSGHVAVVTLALLEDPPAMNRFIAALRQVK